MYIVPLHVACLKNSLCTNLFQTLYALAVSPTHLNKSRLSRSVLLHLCLECCLLHMQTVLLCVIAICNCNLEFRDSAPLNVEVIVSIFTPFAFQDHRRKLRPLLPGLLAGMLALSEK